MLADAPLIAFVPVTDLARARRFYETTLGLSVIDENPSAVVVSSHGVTLRLTQVADGPATVLTICRAGFSGLQRSGNSSSGRKP